MCHHRKCFNMNNVCNVFDGKKIMAEMQRTKYVAQLYNNKEGTYQQIVPFNIC